jgi:hypothetical protein
VFILLHVVHGRVVLASWVAGVDAHEQELDEVCRNLRDALVPWKTRWDVAGLELWFLAVVLLGIRITKVHILLCGVAVSNVCRFLAITTALTISAGSIRLAGVQVEVDLRGATEVDGAGEISEVVGER